MTEESFVLLKPDAVQRGLEPHVRAALLCRGLTLTQRADVVLDRERIRLLWPGMREHLLGVEMLGHYLQNADCVMLRARGWNTTAIAMRVKRDFRRGYGARFLGSLIHSPDTPAEALRELDLLKSWAQPQGPASYSPEAEGTDRDRSTGGDVDLSSTVSAMLRSLDRHTFVTIAPLAPRQATHQVVISTGRDGTPDQMMRALSAARPDLPLGLKVKLVLQLDAISAAPVYAGDYRACERTLAELRRFTGLEIDIHPLTT